MWHIVDVLSIATWITHPCIWERNYLRAKWDDLIPTHWCANVFFEKAQWSWVVNCAEQAPHTVLEFSEIIINNGEGWLNRISLTSLSIIPANLECPEAYIYENCPHGLCKLKTANAVLETFWQLRADEGNTCTNTERIQPLIQREEPVKVPWVQWPDRDGLVSKLIPATSGQGWGTVSCVVPPMCIRPCGRGASYSFGWLDDLWGMSPGIELIRIVTLGGTLWPG